MDALGNSITTGDVSYLFYSSISSRYAAFPKILWHADPLLGGNCEIGDHTESVARQ
jgi:hypothetical protein